MASPSERDFDRLAAALANLLASAWRKHQAAVPMGEERAYRNGNATVDQTAAAGEEVRDDASVSRSSS